MYVCEIVCVCVCVFVCVCMCVCGRGGGGSGGVRFGDRCRLKGQWPGQGGQGSDLIGETTRDARRGRGRS